MTTRTIGRLLLAGALATAAVGSVSSAAGEGGLVGVKSRTELEQLDVLLRAGAPAGGLEKLFSQGGRLTMTPPGPELHQPEPSSVREIFVVLSGAATLTLGGELIDWKVYQGDPAEVRSPNMKGGSTRTIATGDVVSVPRGTVHQVKTGVGHIHYMVIKVMGKP
jgi:quercetin dioxygenase-like cupin family protein